MQVRYASGQQWQRQERPSRMRHTPTQCITIIHSLTHSLTLHFLTLLTHSHYQHDKHYKKAPETTGECGCVSLIFLSSPQRRQTRTLAGMIGPPRSVPPNPSAPTKLSAPPPFNGLPVQKRGIGGMASRPDTPGRGQLTANSRYRAPDTPPALSS